MTAHGTPVRRVSFREPARRRGKRISRRGVADGRGVRGFAVATRIPRLPMRFRLRGASRRSRWFASGSPSQRLTERTPVAPSAHGNATRGVSRGGHLPARCRRRSRSPWLRGRHADPTPPNAFPACAARRVARDGSLQEARLTGREIGASAIRAHVRVADRGSNGERRYSKQ